MRVSLDALALRDFKSFRGRHCLDVGSMGFGVHFLRGSNKITEQLGSNGAGKSTLWDALCWCLYGRTVEGLRNPDVRVWNGPKSSIVSVTFVVDGEPRYVTRQTNPNRLLIDGEEVGQDQVDGLVGMSHRTFLHAVLLGQGQPLFLDLTPSEMLAMFSEVLGLSRWEQRSARAAEKVSSLEASKQRKESDVKLAEALIEDTRGQIASVKVENKSWVLTQREKKEALRRAQFEAKRKDGLARQQLERAELEEDMTATQLRLAKTAFEAEFQKLSELRDEVTRLTSEWSGECSKEATIKGKLKNMGADAGECPACGQELKASSLKKLIGGLKRTLKELAESDTAEKLERAKKAYDAQGNHVDSLRPGIDSLEASAKTLVREVARLQAEVKGAENRIKERASEIETLKDAENPFDAQLSSLRKKLKLVKGDLEDKERSLSKTKRLIERYKFWVKGFKDIRLQVLDDVLAELQITSNAMLQEVGLSGWELRFDIERETKSGTVVPGIDVVVHTPGKQDPTKWKCWSGGERQRLRMVVSLALSEILLRHAGVFPDFVILDEPTQHLSDAGINDLCELLAGYASAHDRKVFYTDHHSTESSMFNSVLTIEKLERGSRILV